MRNWCFEHLLSGATALLVGVALTDACPAAVEISAKPTKNMTCSNGVCAPTAAKAVLNVVDLANMLATGDVTVQSDSRAQDIQIDAALSWTSDHRLTLDSHRSVDFAKPVSITGTGGSLTITTNDGGSGGDFRFLQKGHIEFWDAAGSNRIVINGTSYSLIRTFPKLVKAANRCPECHIALAKSVRAGTQTYSGPPIRDFEGALQGLGNNISGLEVASSTAGVDSGGALIGDFDGPALIRDLRLVNVSLSGNVSAQQFGAFAERMNSNAVLQNCYASGTISAKGDQAIAGGLVAINAGGTITDSRTSVSASVGANGTAGGLIGSFTGTEITGFIVENYATGDVWGGSGAKVGGLVGDNLSGSISASYATGSVTGGKNSLVGGLIGANEDANTFPRVDQVYSIGAVRAGIGSTRGGLIGQDAADSSITNAYWDLDTSGIGNPSKGAGNIRNDPGIAGLTDAQLKSGLPAGFDPTLWGQGSTKNGGYPYLLANPAQ